MKFFDTSAILYNPEALEEEPFLTSSVVIQELENIKASKTKTEDVRAAARAAARFFYRHSGYSVVVRSTQHEDILAECKLPVTNDNLILAAAYAHQIQNEDEIEFVTNDIVMGLVAEYIFKLKTTFVSDSVHDTYRGFKCVRMSEEEMAHFYERLDENTYELLRNEYIVVCTEDGDVADILKWDGEHMAAIHKKSLKTLAFGDKIRPRDCYQYMAVDSILSNTVSVISGKAGSGKSLISLVTAMYMIENGKYDRLIILFNPTSVRGASKLGYYSGDMVEKAMQTSIGNVLTTKFGDRYAVDALIKQDKIRLVSMADMRGFEVRDNEILYITEAQNTSTDLLKLCLSRASQNAKIIIEGDYSNQVDDALFEGRNNGMRRAIEVLKGEEIFGCVELQNVWRSKIAELVERM